MLADSLLNLLFRKTAQILSFSYTTLTAVRFEVIWFFWSAVSTSNGPTFLLTLIKYKWPWGMNRCGLFAVNCAFPDIWGILNASGKRAIPVRRIYWLFGYLPTPLTAESLQRGLRYEYWLSRNLETVLVSCFKCTAPIFDSWLWSVYDCQMFQRMAEIHLYDVLISPYFWNVFWDIKYDLGRLILLHCKLLSKQEFSYISCFSKDQFRSFHIDIKYFVFKIPSILIVRKTKVS
jgi:hypothetical protein